jgi:GcrA cell cycle regulator
MRLGDRGVMTARTDFALLWDLRPPRRIRQRDALRPVGGPERPWTSLEANKQMNTQAAISPGDTWSTERVEQLRSFVTAGLTCSQIAAEIGVTRNAVIGKVHRLGLSTSGGRPGRRPSNFASRVRTGPSDRLSEPREPRSRLARLLRAATAGQTVVPFPSPSAGAIDPPTVENVMRCSLLELAGGGCRWPLSDPGKDDFGFCGHAAISGLSYCAGHARLAYRLPSGRRA